MSERPTRPVSVVTGGSRGIGAAITERLAADGHAVCFCYRTDADGADDLVARLTAQGADVMAVPADITVDDDVDRLFETALKLGPLTGLVNNAGVTGGLAPLVDTSPDTLRRVVEINVVGYLLCSRRAITLMSETGGGGIVNVSSAAATLGSPGEYVHYAASKAAVDAMTIGLSKEVGAAGIRVNGVAPGVILTGIHAAGGDPDRPARLAPNIPLGRAGEPAEIAAAVSWLLSPESSYTTGATIRVAGGR